MISRTNWIAVVALSSAIVTLPANGEPRRGQWGFDAATNSASITFLRGGSLKVGCASPGAPATMQLRSTTYLGIGSTNPRRVALTIGKRPFNYDWDYHEHTATLTNLSVLPQILDALADGGTATIAPTTGRGAAINVRFGLVGSRRSIEAVQRVCKTTL